MTDPADTRNVIRASAVRASSQPVMIECSDGPDPSGNRALSVVPLMDGALVAGIEVRCGCGSSVVIECVYEDAAIAAASEVAS